MIITHSLTFHLDRRTDIPTVDVVQGDTGRELSISLLSGGQSWTVPEGVTAAVRFRKSDGTGGCYDTLPDGTAACIISDSTVTVRLVPQTTTVAGIVELQVVLRDEETELATFTVLLSVQADPSLDTLESENYVNLSGWIQAEMDSRWERVFNNDGYINSKVDDLHHKLPVEFTSGTLSTLDGVEEGSPSHIRTGFFACGGREITVVLADGLQAAVYFYDENYEYISRTATFSETFTAHYPAPYARCVAGYADGAASTNTTALARKVSVFCRGDSHDPFRGNIRLLGLKHFSLCEQDGYYQFSASDLSRISGGPDIGCGGILEVRTHGGNEARQQIIRTTDGEVWFRINNQAFRRILPPEEGVSGENGATFIPSVSDSGVLTWTNDQGLENPAAVNITGPQGERGETGAQGPQGEKGDTGATPALTVGTVVTGEAGSQATVSISGSTEEPVLCFSIPAGYTPVKGTDYFTDVDKQELVAQLKSSLSTEVWTFTLEDGTTVDKAVLLNG